MTIYSINPENNCTNIAALICIKFTDRASLIKLFSILRATYNFSHTSVTVDFDMNQIKALKQCSLFNKKPYIICCLFHFGQCIIQKLRKYKIIKKKINNKN